MSRRQVVGLALGSGAARGWSHIGVIRALEEAGIRPDVVAGASVGAAVGAAYVAGKLDAYETFALGLDRRQVVSYFDLSFRGGLIKGRKVFDFLHSDLPDQAIENLDRPFAAVATDVMRGQEVWLRRGRLLDAVRASTAIPGIVTPVRIDDRWLIDGGVVNPVPVSVCRALGADVVIAVDLNTTLLTKYFDERQRPAPPPPPPVVVPLPVEGEERTWQRAMRDMASELQEWIAGTRRRDKQDLPPSMFEVMGATIDIMTLRITRSRMAGDPPEVLIAPRLPEFVMFDFHRAREAIEEGRRATAQGLANASSELLAALGGGAGESQLPVPLGSPSQPGG